jgi:uncharacterized caspase-like protein
MKRLLACLVLLLIPLVPSRALAEKRVALVVGNSAYAHAGKLANPTNDAEDMARKLKELRFDVVTGHNLDNSGMRRLIRDFRAKADGADVALFFYAGHGMQIGGGNVLVPIDAKLEDELDVEAQTIRLDAVLGELERAARINVVLLDACRDNPLAERLKSKIGARSRSLGLTRGLARVEARGADTLIMFATAPGDVAEDGRGRNSPFTAALLRHLGKPEELSVVLKDVVADVRKATGGTQRPQQLAAMERKLYLAGLPTGAPAGDSAETARLKAEIERLKAERERAEAERKRAEAAAAAAKAEEERKTRLAAAVPPPSAPAPPAITSDRRITLKIQSALPLSLAIAGRHPERLAAIVRTQSRGTAALDVVATGTVVGFNLMADAIRDGRLDGGWSVTQVLISSNSTFWMFMGSVPFGHPPERVARWIEGPGRRLLDENAKAIGLHIIPCAILGPEGAWFKTPITAPEDLKGRALRWYGMGHTVLSRFGASPQLMPAGEIYDALVSGRIDGTEFSVPRIDAALGFDKVVSNYYYPSWHHPAWVVDLTLSNATWQRLGPAGQRAIEASCKQLMRETISEIARDEREGLDELRRRGVTVRAYPPAVLAALRKVFEQVAAEESAKNPRFKEVLESYLRFR